MNTEIEVLLAKITKEQKIKVGKLARLSGVTTTVVNRIVEGKSKDVKSLVAIAKTLGYDVILAPIDEESML